MIKRTLKEWETPSVSLTDVGGYLGHRGMGQTNKYLSTTRSASRPRSSNATTPAQTSHNHLALIRRLTPRWR
jgi:hypothetical protein